MLQKSSILNKYCSFDFVFMIFLFIKVSCKRNITVSKKILSRTTVCTMYICSCMQFVRTAQQNDVFSCHYFWCTALLSHHTGFRLKTRAVAVESVLEMQEDPAFWASMQSMSKEIFIHYSNVLAFSRLILKFPHISRFSMIIKILMRVS